MTFKGEAEAATEGGEAAEQPPAEGAAAAEGEAPAATEECSDKPAEEGSGSVFDLFVVQTFNSIRFNFMILLWFKLLTVFRLIFWPF